MYDNLLLIEGCCSAFNVVNPPPSGTLPKINSWGWLSLANSGVILIWAVIPLAVMLSLALMLPEAVISFIIRFPSHDRWGSLLV